MSTKSNCIGFLLLLVFFSLPVGIRSQTKKEPNSKPGNLEIGLLRRDLDKMLSERNFADSFWGLYVKSLKTGEVLYRRNSDKLFLPASSMKLSTTAAGLLLLGSDYRFQTQICARGSIEKIGASSRLKGDLVLRGMGDPSISGRFNGGRPSGIFEDWADSLLKKGICCIDGDIIGSDESFEARPYASGWTRDLDGEWFAPPVSALSFNDNCVCLILEPSGINEAPVVRADPPLAVFKIDNRAITVENSQTENLKAKIQGNNIIVFGTLKKNSGVKKLYLPVDDPALYFVTALKQVLESKGIRVQGIPVRQEDSDFSKMQVLWTNYSPPLKQIIKEINKNSNNFYAEQLLRTIGLEVDDFGSSKNGIKAILELYSVMGIRPDELSLDDGSGLSRLNLISPKQLASVLAYMAKSDEFENFYDSLPIAGLDGTLAMRFQRTKAQGNLRAKAGYIKNVRSIAGYLTTVDQEPLLFVIFANNFLLPPEAASNLQDSIIMRLINFSRKH